MVGLVGQLDRPFVYSIRSASKLIFIVGRTLDFRWTGTSTRQIFPYLTPTAVLTCLLTDR